MRRAGLQLLTLVLGGSLVVALPETWPPSAVTMDTIAPAKRARADARAGLRWILTGWNMSRIREADPVLAADHFDSPLAYAVGNEDGVQNQVPNGFQAVPTLKYESYARFARDVLELRIDSTIRAVIYDPENWSDTPRLERQDPKAYMQRFAVLARQRGYEVVLTPSLDLMLVRGARCGKRSGEKVSEAFVRCEIARAAARHADVYEVQAQVHEDDPESYRWLVQKTHEQARAANSDVVFLSGLSTSPNGREASPQMLLDAHRSVADLVGGHYLTINTSEHRMAIDFLRRLRDQPAADSA